MGFWLNWARVGLIDGLELVSFLGKLRPWLVLLSVWFDGVLFLCIRVDCSRFCAFGSIRSGFSAFGLGSIDSLLLLFGSVSDAAVEQLALDYLEGWDLKQSK